MAFVGRLATFAILLALSHASTVSAATDRQVAWVGVTQVDHCENWSCIGVTGVSGFMIVPLLVNETSADIEISSPTGFAVKMRVTSPSGSVSTVETSTTASILVSFAPSSGTDHLKVIVYDPIIEHQSGTGTAKPIPFSVTATIHS